MSQVTQEDIQNVADVAKIEVKDDELEMFTKTIGHIVQQAEALKNLDLTAEKPITHPLEIYEVLREDEPNNRVSQKEALSNSESTEDGQFKVPKMIS